MLNSPVHTSQMVVSIGGHVPDTLKSAEIVVETSVLQPAVATITVHDPGPRLVDQPWIGKPMVIAAASGSNHGQLFCGEIVEVGMNFTGGASKLVIVAFDLLHRLARGTHTKLYNDTSFADLAQKLAQDAGLGGAKVSGVDQSYESVTQNNETHLAFLRRLAEPLGCLIYVQGETLHCEMPPGVTAGSSSGGLLGDVAGAALGALGLGSTELKWGSNLKEFYPRLTTIGQLNSVTVRGWDPSQQDEVVGKAESAQGDPQIGQVQSGDHGGDLAKKAFGIKAELVVPSTFEKQDDAENLAQAVLNHHEGYFITAEGTCSGEPEVVAGTSTKISQVGARFSGTYYITSARHVYRQDYTTQFSASLYHPLTLLHMLESDRETRPTAPSGMAVAIVTNNDDPDNAGRVKLKFPWLSSDYESAWARVLAPGGGDGRGIQFHPIVNQEVLVGFELGDIERPYVLGALWSDDCKLPQPDHASNGKVTTCVVASTNHTITFNDQPDDQDAGDITIKDKKGNTITLKASANDGGITLMDSAGNTITLSSGSPAGITIESKGDLAIEASGNVTIKGKQINLN